jgi:HD superfamily phosphohydrolase
MGESRNPYPIHGFIELNGDECKIIDSPVFQRLRRIRQLAFAYLVYPGALHTRFDHTLGVFHVASRMATAFELNDDEKRLVRLAALLHDLGHGPFSHVSEGALDLFADRTKLADAPSGQKADKIHEMLTRDILDKDQSLTKILGIDTLSSIKKLLLHGYGDPILKSIISGPLDADKQDYLLRDTYLCGVKYGIFDIERLHRMLLVVPDTLEEKQLMIKPDGVHTLEQFILAKYYLTAQVYRHRVRRITDEMVVRAIVLGIEKDSIR